MNNKIIGSQFEKEFCAWLVNKGYWVHFITPAPNGSQPFDVIAVKDGHALAFDCKTCAKNKFNIKRLEANQIMAFDKWLACNNYSAYIAVKHNGDLYIVQYAELKIAGSVSLKDQMRYKL